MILEQVINDLKNKTVTSVALVESCLGQINARNHDLNALLRVYGSEALAAAKASDARRLAGQPLSDFDGVPVVIKDNFSFLDHIVSAGSNMLKDYIAPYDATVVKKLKEAGTIIIAAANMDEFAMGSTGENSAFGLTKNPLDPTRVPGGSSSGSAVAVASDMVPLAFGSDTGGSIRLPASYCGIAGLKPTYGAVSRYGLLAMASSFDQIGPLATTVDGVKLAFDLIRGFDPLDSTSMEPKNESPSHQSSITIGVPKQFCGAGIDPKVLDVLEKTIQKLETAGYTVVRDIDLPILDRAISIYYTIVPAEVSANFARYDGIRFGVHAGSPTESRTQGFGAEVKRRIILGTYVLSAGYADKFYKRAQAARSQMKHDLNQAMSAHGVAMLLGPVAPHLPFKLGAKTNDPLTMYLEDIFTVPANLTGRPALSVPAGMVDQDGACLSVGMQLLGAAWEEEKLFQVGKIIEETPMKGQL